MPHNIMSVNLKPHVICSKTVGTWVEVVVVVVVVGFFLIFARHIEWLYSKNRLLTYNHHLCFLGKIEQKSNFRLTTIIFTVLKLFKYWPETFDKFE